jgi:hypothetical protein
MWKLSQKYKLPVNTLFFSYLELVDTHVDPNIGWVKEVDIHSEWDTSVDVSKTKYVVELGADINTSVCVNVYKLIYNNLNESVDRRFVGRIVLGK